MASNVPYSVIPTHPLEELAWRSDYTFTDDSSKAELHSLLRGLHDVLGQHDAEIARLQATLDRLFDQRKSYVLRVDKLKSALALHKKLPPELLSQIFTDCSSSPLNLPPDPIRGIGFASARGIFPPMEVCSRWREIALNTRDLWDEVHIKYPDYINTSSWVRKTGHLSEIAQKIISRGTRSITLLLRSNPPDIVPKALDPLRKLLFPFSHQFTHINLACSRHHLYEFLHSSSLSFPILEYLTLQGDRTSGGQYNWDFAMFKDISKLKTLELHFMDQHMSTPFSAPWDQLTEINFKDTWLDPWIVHNVLSQCTSLVSCRLSIDCTVADTNITPFAAVIRLPRLQSLSIAGIQGNPRVIMLFSQSLILPSLHSVEIEQFNVIDVIPGLLSLISRSRCALTSFLVPIAQIPALLLDSLLEILPALENLDIPKVLIPNPTLERIARGVLLPNLMGMNCTIQSSARSLEWFMDAVERIGAEDPGVTRLRVAFVQFPPTESHYKALRWPQTIERFRKLAEKLREEGRLISLPEFHGTSSSS